jgi:hypothetical protein
VPPAVEPPTVKVERQDEDGPTTPRP